MLILARLIDPMEDKDKCGTLLRFLPESFGFLVFVADANQIEYDSVCELLKSEMKKRKTTKAKKSSRQSIIPDARIVHEKSGTLNKDNLQNMDC